MSWGWLENPARPARWAVMWRVALKALILFALVNLAYAALDPLDALGRVSIYNVLVPGRERLINSYHANVIVTYQSAVTNVPALIASNTAAAPKTANELRVLILGDSGARAHTLTYKASFTYLYNQMPYKTDDGRDIVMYNLAHPVPSLFKDFMLLEESLRQNFQPDLVIWMTTLRSATPQRQYNVEILRDNVQRAQRLAAEYSLNIAPENFITPTFWERTVIGQRRLLANILRLQTFGFAWATARYDGDNEPSYAIQAQKNITNFPADVLEANNQPPSHFAFDVIDAGYRLLGDVPLIIINEPTYDINNRDNPQVMSRYYRRDIYEHYQRVIQQYADENGWRYFDLWDAIPSEHFTNTPLHYDAEGARILAERLADIITQVLAEEAQ